MSDPSTLLQTGPLRRSRTLSDSARPLMALATRLRRSVAVEAEHMQQGLVVGVGRFERELAEADWSERDISAASYLLCAWVDELVADTPWASAGPGLLQRFHGETEAGDKLLRLLSHLAEKPKENRALLELFHACLSLGLTGPLAHSPDGAQRLATLRARLYQALPQAPADAPAPIAPPWRNAVTDLPPPVRRRKVVALLLAFSLLLLAGYTGSHLVLARRVDEVFASLQQLATPALVATAASAPVAAPTPPAPARLAPLLKAEVAAQRLLVRDERHRSVVSVPASQLFSGAQAQLSADGRALLTRVAAALAPLGGKLVVVGHTDGQDARSARLPSAWHQSFEWAREVSGALAGALPAAQLSVEGAGSLADSAADSPPARRVDIVLYP
ncbi:type IV / VI secretion system protein, DotU family [Burkholderiales bacterium JOSHI_001]|nr:type IV / VI secretion system protein, DotU family [Burkholderiales bacterium JOSHI_001]